MAEEKKDCGHDEECGCGHDHPEIPVEQILMENHFLLNSLIDFMVEKKQIDKEEFQEFINERAKSMHQH
jgi:hypothetical protein